VDGGAAKDDVDIDPKADPASTKKAVQFGGRFENNADQTLLEANGDEQSPGPSPASHAVVDGPYRIRRGTDCHETASHKIGDKGSCQTRRAAFRARVVSTLEPLIDGMEVKGVTAACDHRLPHPCICDWTLT